MKRGRWIITTIHWSVCVCVCKHIHLSSHSSPSNMCFADDCIIRAYYCDYEYHSHRPVLAFNEFINLYCRTLSMSLNCLHAKFEHSDRIQKAKHTLFTFASFVTFTMGVGVDVNVTFIIHSCLERKELSSVRDSPLINTWQACQLNTQRGSFLNKLITETSLCQQSKHLRKAYVITKDTFETAYQ